jgi:release factor glutamine methyltransferase
MTDDFKSRGIESARLEAELLVAHSLGIDRVRLYMELDRPLDDAERAAIRELALRRRKREPVAYLIGSREFYGRRFRVTPDVLIPRPDTETLVDAALERWPEGEARVLDLGTGSGAIAITLAAERPSARVDATDISAAALTVARGNAESLGVIERMRFFEGDLFAPLPRERYDVVVANPPYVAETERETLMPDVRDFEPAAALFAGPSGLAIHERIAAGVRDWLAPGGSVLVEVGAGQAPRVAALFEANGLTNVSIHRDLGRIERVVRGTA